MWAGPACWAAHSLWALDDLVTAGKIRYYGTTTFEPHQLVEAQWVADDRKLHRPVSEQPPYSILARGAERATLPVAQRYGLGVLTWSPLAGGWLSGRYRSGADAPASSRLQRQPHRHDPALTVNHPDRAGNRLRGCTPGHLGHHHRSAHQ
ncbi:aldo/keto reductase [Nocardia mikamii]|uniref:aldo/keto reductase n=1 Tax=Nocardia mikamii TaxID=508464 RepID=UPI00350E5A3A